MRIAKERGIKFPPALDELAPNLPSLLAGRTANTGCLRFSNPIPYNAERLLRLSHSLA
jgi:hypothetical protein